MILKEHPIFSDRFSVLSSCVTLYQAIIKLLYPMFATNLKDYLEKDLDDLHEKAETFIFRAFRKAIDLDLSPRADLKKKGCLLEKTMFSKKSPRRGKGKRGQTFYLGIMNPEVQYQKPFALLPRSCLSP